MTSMLKRPVLAAIVAAGVVSGPAAVADSPTPQSECSKGVCSEPAGGSEYITVGQTEPVLVGEPALAHVGELGDIAGAGTGHEIATPIGDSWWSWLERLWRECQRWWEGNDPEPGEPDPAPSQPAPSQPAPTATPSPAPSNPAPTSAPSPTATSTPTTPAPSSPPSGSPTSAPTSTDPGQLPADLAKVVELVNVERATAGLGALSVDTCLNEKVAQPWADYMASSGDFRHQDMGDAAAQCPGMQGVGENIAMGYTSPEAVMQGWMDSSGHRANILRSGYTVIGVGVATNSSGQKYWVQNFGMR